MRPMARLSRLVATGVLLLGHPAGFWFSGGAASAGCRLRPAAGFRPLTCQKPASLPLGWSRPSIITSLTSWPLRTRIVQFLGRRGRSGFWRPCLFSHGRAMFAGIPFACRLALVSSSGSPLRLPSRAAPGSATPNNSCGIAPSVYACVVVLRASHHQLDRAQLAGQSDLLGLARASPGATRCGPGSTSSPGRCCPGSPRR